MRNILVILLVLVLSSFAFAVEIRVEDMTLVEGLDRSFVLKTSLPDKVVLDCQSFIQGLNIGTENLFLLDPDECEGLQDRIFSTISETKQHCLEVEDFIRADYICQ